MLNVRAIGVLSRFLRSVIPLYIQQQYQSTGQSLSHSFSAAFPPLVPHHHLHVSMFSLYQSLLSKAFLQHHLNMLFLSFALILVSQTEHDLLPLLNFQSTLNISWMLLCSWNSPGKNSGVDSHSLLQGIFPTQGSNPGLPHCGQILFHLSYQGSPIFITFYLKVKCWYYSLN